jgi:hypothetical protein
MRAWRAATIKEIRELVKEKNVSRSVEKERRREATQYDMKSYDGFSVCCSKDWVEFSKGQAQRCVRFDATDEEWNQVPWRRIGL